MAHEKGFRAVLSEPFCFERLTKRRAWEPLGAIFASPIATTVCNQSPRVARAYALPVAHGRLRLFGVVWQHLATLSAHIQHTRIRRLTRSCDRSPGRSATPQTSSRGVWASRRSILGNPFQDIDLLIRGAESHVRDKIGETSTIRMKTDPSRHFRSFIAVGSGSALPATTAAGDGEPAPQSTRNVGWSC